MHVHLIIHNYAFRVENLTHEMNQLQSSLIVKEAKWTGREQSYRRTINELETKVCTKLNKL